MLRILCCVVERSIRIENVITNLYTHTLLYPFNSLDSKPATRKLGQIKEAEVAALKQQERDIHYKVQEQKLKGLIERQKRLEKFMLPSAHRPPVYDGWRSTPKHM